MSGDVSPQVIMRGDKYVIHNLDFSGYTRLEKLVLAVQVWDQVRMLMEVAGRYRAPNTSVIGDYGVGTTSDIDRETAEMVGVTLSALKVVRPRLKGRPDVIEKITTGEIKSLHDVQRALGMKLRVRLDEGRESQAKLTDSYYGKGDKFDEALEPVVRYLTGWRKRGFWFSHVPPRAAQKRISVIDEVIAGLEEARRDLERRSHLATLAAPREDKRRERS